MNILHKLLCPSFGQRKALLLQSLHHPNKGYVGQGPCLRRSHHLPAHISMISSKPDLLHQDLPIGWILPHLWPIGVAGFVQGQSVKPGADTCADLMVVKPVFALEQPPEARQAQPKRFDRVPNPNRRDGDI